MVDPRAHHRAPCKLSGWEVLPRGEQNTRMHTCTNEQNNWPRQPAPRWAVPLDSDLMEGWQWAMSNELNQVPAWPLEKGVRCQGDYSSHKPHTMTLNLYDNFYHPKFKLLNRSSLLDMPKSKGNALEVNIKYQRFLLQKWLWWFSAWPWRLEA